MPNRGAKPVESVDRGQNAVEFAILLPLLLLVVFGVLDLGRLFHGAITIASAARAGARYATLHPDEFDDPGDPNRFSTIENAVIAEAADSGIDLTDADVSEIGVSCPPADACQSGDPVRVEVTYSLELLLPSFFSAPDVPVYGFAEFRLP